jgi:GAF domain-containing protein
MSFASVEATSDYSLLIQQAQALFHGEQDAIANAANLSSLIYHGMADLNWAGFYFLKDGELVLGPFHGQPACVRIPLGKGVCGTAAATKTTQRIDDVDQFPGHIACDAASRSEVVVPLVRDGELLGVLDIDSPKLQRFTAAEQEALEQLAHLWLAASQ